MGRRVHTYEWRVSECEPPHRLGFETLSGPMRPAGTMVFRSEGQATQVDFEMMLNPSGWMKLLAPVIERHDLRAGCSPQDPRPRSRVSAEPTARVDGSQQGAGPSQLIGAAFRGRMDPDGTRVKEGFRER